MAGNTPGAQVVFCLSKYREGGYYDLLFFGGGMHDLAVTNVYAHVPDPLRRLYLAMRSDGEMPQNANMEKAIDALFEFTKDETNFDGEGYGRMLEQMEVELAKA